MPLYSARLTLRPSTSFSENSGAICAPVRLHLCFRLWLSLAVVTAGEEETRANESRGDDADGECHILIISGLDRKRPVDYVLAEPAAARIAFGPAESHLGVLPGAAEQPAGGVAEAFADVVFPAARPILDVGFRQLQLHRFGGPAEFAESTPFSISCDDQLLVRAAQRAAEFRPDKMEDLMDEDALQHARRAQHLLVEDDLALSQERSGVDGVAFRRFRQQFAAISRQMRTKTDVNSLALREVAACGRKLLPGRRPRKRKSSLFAVWLRLCLLLDALKECFIFELNAGLGLRFLFPLVETHVFQLFVDLVFDFLVR